MLIVSAKVQDVRTAVKLRSGRGEVCLLADRLARRRFGLLALYNGRTRWYSMLMLLAKLQCVHAAVKFRMAGGEPFLLDD